jgi:hypothetical protein
MKMFVIILIFILVGCNSEIVGDTPLMEIPSEVGCNSEIIENTSVMEIFSKFDEILSEIIQMEIVESNEVLRKEPSTTVETAAYFLFPEEIKFDFGPLELLNYYVEENGRIIINANWENICEPDILRKYTFGTWKGWAWGNKDEYQIIDDSEMNNCYLWLTGGFYQEGDIIIFVGGGHATQGIFWLDINEPNIMYCIEVSSRGNNKFSLMNDGYENIFHYISILEKTNAAINEPGNDFVSNLRLFEIDEF